MLTRLGWGILLAVLALGALLASMVRIVPAGSRVEPRATVAPAWAGMPVDPAVPGALVVPVAGVARGALREDWGDDREGGARHHTGLDIMAPGGTPALAAADGVVERLWQSAAGGNTIYLRSADRAWTYYYAHLAGYAPGLHEGSRVRAGERIGFVGDTGNAGAGNTHLHFGVTRMRGGERWYQGEPVNPYPLLTGQ
jgi:murein DD-endopeptidase MepM/ murein hydrolase activator NlpD